MPGYKKTCVALNSAGSGSAAKGIDITDITFRKLMPNQKPGYLEYEIEAEIYHSFLSKKQRAPANDLLLPAANGQKPLAYVEKHPQSQEGEIGTEWILGPKMWGLIC